MDFSPDTNIRESPALVRELFAKVLFDEEPIFISDEATIYDVCVTPVDELRARLTKQYGIALSEDELKMPLWKLLVHLQMIRTR